MAIDRIEKLIIIVGSAATLLVGAVQLIMLALH
jgi:hypothetical protein